MDRPYIRVWQDDIGMVRETWLPDCCNVVSGRRPVLSNKSIVLTRCVVLVGKSWAV